MIKRKSGTSRPRRSSYLPLIAGLGVGSITLFGLYKAYEAKYGKKAAAILNNLPISDESKLNELLKATENSASETKKFQESINENLDEIIHNEQVIIDENESKKPYKDYIIEDFDLGKLFGVNGQYLRDLKTNKNDAEKKYAFTYYANRIKIKALRRRTEFGDIAKNKIIKCDTLYQNILSVNDEVLKQIKSWSKGDKSFGRRKSKKVKRTRRKSKKH